MIFEAVRQGRPKLGYCLKRSQSLIIDVGLVKNDNRIDGKIDPYKRKQLVGIMIRDGNIGSMVTTC